ncbi:MAG: flagellar brake protein [Thermodesulfobacteriota bacterium]
MPEPERKSRRVSGEDLRLTGGQDIFLQAAGDRARLRCLYLGRRSREYLIVDPPLVPDFKTRFAPGVKVTARLLHEGTVYGFVSSVLHLSQRPTPLLFLDYPFTVEAINLRSCERVEAFVPALLSLEAGTAHGVITDLSCSGCQFAADLEASPESLSPLAVGAGVLLSFSTAGGENVSDLPATVLNVRRERGAIHLGLNFDKIGRQAEEAIAGLVADLGRFANR